MSNVKVFLAEGFEEIEALSVVDFLRRADIEVDMVSILDELTVTGAHGIKVTADTTFNKMTSDADMLVLPGGMPGTIYLKEHVGLKELLIKHNSEGKRIAAICAAPTVLGSHGILKGHKAVCYPGMEDGLCCEYAGEVKVVTDGNITTSKGPGTAIWFALELIELLKGKEVSEKIRKSLVLVWKSVWNRLKSNKKH